MSGFKMEHWSAVRILKHPESHDPCQKDAAAKHAIEVIDRVRSLERLLADKEPECEPCEEMAIGRAQAYWEVRNFLKTGAWKDCG
jgi:hypothetical protein